MSTVTEEAALSDMFAALASSTRRGILARLAAGDATVSEIAEPFDMSLPAISKHISVLERAGLVERSQRAQFRPCALNPAALDQVSAWAASCRATWERRFDRLDAHLKSAFASANESETDEHEH